MTEDPVRGKKIRWTYDDGPVAGKTFEHSFGADGKVTYTEIGPASKSYASEPSITYEVARVSPDTYAVSYLAASGWTLTTVVDERSGRIVSVASNEKQLVLQRGKLA